MSEVKRYMPVARYIGDNKYEAVMLPLDGFPAKVIEERGRFVLHSDYAALAAERDQLRAERDALRASIVALADEWERLSRRFFIPQTQFAELVYTYQKHASQLRKLGEGNGHD